MNTRTERAGLLRRLWRGRRARPARRQLAPPPGNWRRTVYRRLVVIGCGFAAWVAAVETRLVHLQILQHDVLQARAHDQHLRTVPLHPKRGEILDRNGRVLAYSVDTDSVFAVPAEIREPDRTAGALCSALDECGAELRKTIADRLRRDNAFAYVKRQATPEEARRVAELGLQGVGFLTEDRRYYPNGELGAHLLGYVGIDNQGLSGIESTYDTEIRGNTGQLLVQTDGRRRVFGRLERPPTAGATVELTIDKQLQHIVERELRAGILAYEADAGAVVMLDPRTGEVLALASEPTFNPNAFRASTPERLRNRAVQDLYEPGSTFKVVTASAAFEERLVDRDEIFDVSAGAIRIGGDRIPDFRPYGPLSFTDVIVRSSNVGAILVGLRLGPERMSRYVRRFGFGQSLSTDFPSESRGLVSPPDQLNDRSIASVSMGYNVAVTPLQMAAAVAAVANGGELLEPRLVRAVTRNGERVASAPRVIRRAISRATAAELTDIMQEVVQRGTARRAQVPGHAVAGKTGTAEKLIDGRYSHYDHNASFVGFVPADDPRLAILVMLDTPRSRVLNGVRQRAYTGGAVAAPIFQRIAEASLRHLAVPPADAVPPAVLLTDATSARRRPVPSPVAADRSQATGGAASDDGLMPDLRGLSAREAVDAVGHLGLRAAIVGDGGVTRQEPTPGDVIEPGSLATFWLDRRAVSGPEPGDADFRRERRPARTPGRREVRRSTASALLEP